MTPEQVIGLAVAAAVGAAILEEPGAFIAVVMFAP